VGIYGRQVDSLALILKISSLGIYLLEKDNLYYCSSWNHPKVPFYFMQTKDLAMFTSIIVAAALLPHIPLLSFTTSASLNTLSNMTKKVTLGGSLDLDPLTPLALGNGFFGS
jgi:hypothetical protein